MPFIASDDPLYYRRQRMFVKSFVRLGYELIFSEPLVAGLMVLFFVQPS